MRVLLVLLGLVLAGCAGQPTTEPGEEPEVITDPRDLSYNGTGYHLHDYWAGQDRLELLDASRASTWNTIGSGTWTVPFFPPDGNVVPQGTSMLEITVDWVDDVAANSYGDVSLWLKTPLQNVPEQVAVVKQGDVVEVPVAYAEADLPHQVLSAWEFQVRYASGGPYSAFFGSTQLHVEAIRGHELQPFPPHPDHWQNQTQLPLVDDERSFFWIAYTGTGYLPQRVRALEGAVVPPDAQVVTLTLTADNDLPVGGLRLAFHGADTRQLTALTPHEVEGATMHYRIDVEDGMADGPYANESLWEFRVDVESTQPPGQALFQGRFSLEATVHRHAME